MRYLIIAVIVLSFSGCSNETKKLYMAAIKSCEKQNGVPILNTYGRMTECKFRNLEDKSNVSSIININED